MKATRVVNSVIYNYLNLVFITGTGFVYTAILLRHLSHVNFGILALVNSVLLYVGLLNLGVGMTVMKMVAERAVSDPLNEIPGIIGNALMLFGALSVVAVIVVFAFEPFAGVAFHLSGSREHTFRIALAIATPGVAVVLPSALYTGVHQAFQDYRYIAVSAIVSQFVGVVVGVVLLLHGYGVIPLVVLATVRTVATFVVKVFHAHRKFGLRLALGRPDRELVRQMFATSVWVLLLNIASQAIYSSDVVIAGAVLGTAAVASYQVALGPAIGLKSASDQFGAVSLTAAATLNAQNETAELRRLLTEATRVVFATVCPGVVVFVVWGRRLIELWAGKSYLSSYPTLVVLSLALLVAAMQGTSAQLLFALNRYRRLAILSVGEAAVNVGLSIVLARKFGIVGVAWGTAIPITVMTLGLYVPMACRLVGIAYGQLLRRIFLPFALNLAMYILLRLVSNNGTVFPDIVTLLASGVAVFAVCFSLAILLDGKERATYLDMLRSVTARQRA